MKNLKDFLIKENYSEADSYLNKIKGKEISFDELKKGLDKECYMNDVEWSEENGKKLSSDGTGQVTVVYNPHNNADGPDILLAINTNKEATKEKLIVKSWDYQEL